MRIAQFSYFYVRKEREKKMPSTQASANMMFEVKTSIRSVAKTIYVWALLQLTFGVSSIQLIRDMTKSR
jgi:hypothetical protein